jgi:protein-disulfide isomerase
MFRRFLVTVVRRSFVILILICLGCSAQSLSPELSQRIERQVRATYSLPVDVKVIVGAGKPSEFPNYDALTITLSTSERKQDVPFLLSKDGKTLIRMTKMDLSKDPYADLMKKIDTTGRPTRGNKDAKVIAVNYDDFQCPYCSRMHEQLFPTLFKEYGDRVLFIYKDYPLTEIHTWATHAAVNANCLAAQNNDAYWDFADYIHANQKDVNSEKGTEARFALLDKITVLQGQKHNLDLVKLQSCIKAQKDDAVKSSMKEGDTLGVSATPTLFINGEKVDGALPLSDLRAVFDRALQQAGVAVPVHNATTPASNATPPPGN